MCSVITTPIAVVIAPSIGEMPGRAMIQQRLASVAGCRMLWESWLFLIAVQAAEPVECCGLVALGKSGVIEDRVHKVVNSATHDHHCLTDVNQFTCAFADDMDAKNLA